uniref:Capsid protein n=1 Tax=Cruciviridae sp. TaxID=1955495 RepID=A0A1S6LVI0_9VIRU|nr:capsid protein [Cruciviridae sp.]AQU11723.1 capsid protein [Cruciviridae sp.]
MSSRVYKRRTYVRRAAPSSSRRFANPATTAAMLRNLIQGAGAYKKRVYKRRAPVKPRASKMGLGESMGRSIGAGLGKIFGKVTGLGDYQINRNSLLQHGSSSDQVPFMHSSKDGVRIRHREYIQDVSSSILFTNNTFSLNPGVSATFPWLSAIAQNFEQYRMEGFICEFKSTSADALNSTNTALGTVVIAAEYNTTAPAYVNKQQMENSMWCVSGKPSVDICMPVECSPSLNPLSNLYIRTGAVPSGQDQRLYDLCNIQVATVGSQAAAVIGELWVSYDVILLKPQLFSSAGEDLKSAHYSLVAPAVTTAYFGTSATAVGTDSIGLVLTGTVCTLPIGLSGFFQLTYSANGASTAITSPTFTFANSSLVTGQFNNLTSNSFGSTSGETTVSYSKTLWFKISDPSLAATITLSGGTLPGTPTYGDLIINQLNYSTA